MNDEYYVYTIEDLFKIRDAFYKLFDKLDENYEIYDNNDVMRAFKRFGYSFRIAFYADIFDCLFAVGLRNNELDGKRLEFINELLDLELSEDDYMGAFEFTELTMGLKPIPVIFAIFMELDDDPNLKDFHLVDLLFAFFVGACYRLMESYGTIDEDHQERFDNHFSSLRDNLLKCDLKTIQKEFSDILI